MHSDKIYLGDENYVVGFEGEITVGVETKGPAENQAYDPLSHLGQITVMAFKKEGEQGRVFPFVRTIPNRLGQKKF